MQVRLAAAALLAAALIAAAPPARADAPPRAQRMVDILCEAAAEFGVACGTLVAVAKCESGLDPSNVGDHGHSVGLMQFHDGGIWHDLPRAITGGALANRWDAEISARAAAYAFAHGYARHWTCYRRLYGGRR